MNASVTISPRSADFQRSFVALRYYWGARGEVLTDAFEQVGVTTAAADVLAGLTHAERVERARALSVELSRLAAALDAEGLWR